MPDVFVSYAREDESRVRELVEAFEAQHWSVFWDRRIPAGATWRSHIGEALAMARCVVVAWSRHSIESHFVAEEAEEGKSRAVLVPVLIDPVPPPLGFRSIHAADLTGWRRGRPDPQLDRLLSDIAALLRRTEAPPPGGGAPVPNGSPSGGRPPVPAKSHVRLLGLTVLALVLVAGLGYLVIRGPGFGPRPPVSPAEQSVPASPSGDAPTARVSARVVESWRAPDGGIALRVEVRNDDRVPRTFSPANALRLVSAGAEPLPPTRSAPVFETLRPGETLVFEVRFPPSPGAAALRLLDPAAGPSDLGIGGAR